MTIIRFIILCVLMQPVLAAEPTLEIIPLRHLTAEQAVALVKPFIDKDGALSGHNNQLIVRTTPENLAQIRQMLKTLDVAQRRLLITVRQDGRSDQADSEASLRGSIKSGDVRISTHRAPAPRDGAEVRIIHSDSLVHDKNTQQIQVLEGNPAFIEIGQSVPVVERSVEGSGIDPRLYSSITYKDVTTGFSVLPRVSGDVVTLEIAPQRATPSAQGGGSIDIAQMHTTVSGKLGEWIDIGGAVQEQGSSASEIVASTRALRNEQHRVLVKVEEVGARLSSP
ncbi:MAG: secretin N-terminal domain-containing protein [Gammaproteobacteria bacterium]|nr:secretin N-terminal domain-containing protein [Gammaproteobacteria bacterium]